MQLQDGLDLPLIWLETNPPNGIFTEMRSLPGAPPTFLNTSASTGEGIGVGKGEGGRLNLFSSSTDLH